MAAKPAPTYGAIRAEYDALWRSMEVAQSRIPTADAIVAKIVANRGRYDAVSRTTNVPWFVIAVIHSLESGLSFRGHLHNGDPLTARTVQVPAGRPSTGSPPFAWETSAIDALTMKGLNEITDWSIERIGYELERYNGWGYRLYHPTTLSPYLWSFSNHYRAGKYVADGKWSATAVSEQCGAMVLLKRLEALGHITIGARPEPAPIPRQRPTEPVPPPPDVSPPEQGKPATGLLAWFLRLLAKLW